MVDLPGVVRVVGDHRGDDPARWSALTPICQALDVELGVVAEGGDVLRKPGMDAIEPGADLLRTPGISERLDLRCSPQSSDPSPKA